MFYVQNVFISSLGLLVPAAGVLVTFEEDYLVHKKDVLGADMERMYCQEFCAVFPRRWRCV